MSEMLESHADGAARQAAADRASAQGPPPGPVVATTSGGC